MARIVRASVCTPILWDSYSKFLILVRPSIEIAFSLSSINRSHPFLNISPTRRLTGGFKLAGMAPGYPLHPNHPQQPLGTAHGSLVELHAHLHLYRMRRLSILDILVPLCAQSEPEPHLLSRPRSNSSMHSERMVRLLGCMHTSTFTAADCDCDGSRSSLLARAVRTTPDRTRPYTSWPRSNPSSPNSRTSTARLPRSEAVTWRCRNSTNGGSLILIATRNKAF